MVRNFLRWLLRTLPFEGDVMYDRVFPTCILRRLTSVKPTLNKLCVHLLIEAHRTPRVGSTSTILDSRTLHISDWTVGRIAGQYKHQGHHNSLPKTGRPRTVTVPGICPTYIRRRWAQDIAIQDLRLSNPSKGYVAWMLTIAETGSPAAGSHSDEWRLSGAHGDFSAITYSVRCYYQTHRASEEQFLMSWRCQAIQAFLPSWIGNLVAELQKYLYLHYIIFIFNLCETVLYILHSSERTQREGDFG